MTFEEFNDSLNNEYPPSGLPQLLKALWHVANDDWNTAHRIANDDFSKDGALIHGFLHRREGDEGNARYWYQRSGTTYPNEDISLEWEKITRRIIEKYA